MGGYDTLMLSYNKASGIVKPHSIEGTLCQYVANNLSKLSFKSLSGDEEQSLITQLATKFIRKHFRGEPPKIEVRYNKKWREYSTKNFDWHKYLEFEKIIYVQDKK